MRKFILLSVGILFSIQTFSCDPNFYYTSACAGDTVHFYGVQQGSAFTWDFGDTSSGAANISHDPTNTFHIYNTPGTYYATLLVNWYGAILTQTQLINIGTDCMASQFSYYNCGGQYHFTSESTGNYLSLHWDFGDTSSSTNTATGLSSGHNYLSAGTYIVTLIADYGTTSDTAYDTINVMLAFCTTDHPVVDMGYIDQYCMNDTVDFNLTNFDGYACFFDFGDSASGASDTTTIQTPFSTSHQYSAPGIYYVTVTCYYGYGSRTLYATVTVDDCNVWPGNVNNDGVVDMDDLFAIGLSYGTTGPSRSTISNSWIGNSAPKWTGLSQGLQKAVNKKFADCNGDGVINNSDLTAIENNYGRTATNYNHNDSVQDVEGLNDPALILNTTFPWTGSYDVSIPLDLITNGLIEAYGVSARLKYNKNDIVPGSINITPVSSWLGNPGTNMIYLSKDNYTDGYVDFGMVGTDDTSKYGYGTIAYLNFTMSHPTGYMIFHLDHTKLILADDESFGIEFFRPIIKENGTLLNTDAASVPENVSNNIKVFPNPVTDRLYIRVDEMTINGIEIRNTLGQSVFVSYSTNGNMVELNTQNLATGIYSLILTNGNTVLTKKFTKQ